MNNLIIIAATLAAKLHDGQIRKASLVPGVPYLSHLMEVAGMVQSAGGSDEAVAAAWLHDVLEDTDCTTDQIAVMPDTVIRLILECTEIGTSGAVKSPWQERKDAYIAHLSTVSTEALLISVADKLQSLRGLRWCVRVQGDAAYQQLVKSAPTVAERRALTLWFNEQVHQAAVERLQTLQDPAQPFANPLLVGIEALVEDMYDILLWLRRH
jgi:(p)ppGpp synthase/HD superfamily hydrolase